MEDIILNIDSKYRDTDNFPSESKFKYILDKSYRNIITAKLTTIELNNNISCIDSKKLNNWFTIHLPNKINDPDGTKIELNNSIIDNITTIQTLINESFNNTFNNNEKLKLLYFNNKIFAEKYFYFFYLNENITFDFDFNADGLLPSTLSKTLILKEGWYSLYGFVKQIINYITDKFNERIIYKNNNPLTTPIDLDNGDFLLNTFSLKIFDRRFRSINSNIPTVYDCIRIDTFIPSGTYSLNNTTLKEDIYKLYIYDIITFSTLSIDTTVSVNDMGILDKLVTNNYTIPLGFDYINEGNLLLSESKYFINNNNLTPTNNSIQIYNLLLNINSSSYTVSFDNIFNDFYYYYVDPSNINPSTWNNTTNTMNNLLSKQFQREHKFITSSQFNDFNYKITMKKDISTFEINFNTFNDIINPVNNGVIELSKMRYPTLGYYLGYRSNIKNNDPYLYSSKISNNMSTIQGDKMYNINNNYIFLKINNWGYIDFFNRQMFAKIITNTNNKVPRLDDYLNKEYQFRQPVNVQQLDIELVDFLGNTLDLNGIDFSFTLQLKQMLNSDQKNHYEKNNLFF